MTANPLIQRLNHAGFLSQVEQDALHALVLKSRCIQAREDIAQSRSTQTIPLILSGIACRYKFRPDGQRRIVHFLLPGDLYDLHASAHFASHWHLGALTRCQVVDVQRQALLDLAARHPGIAQGLWWATLVELEIEREWLVNDSRPADRRLGHLFCELLVRLQTIGLARDNSCDLRLTQVDLADAIAVSFVHINRIMQSLRNNNLIQCQRGYVKIIDYDRLCEFSEFDPAFLHLSKNA
ncbi:Crp/Fnr family transcriptional regulator [Methylobacterium nonmethylotrophicum]|nr:Crp/Fnr family transcriptional regulator [Methylobacterium nonmethylotrophicum]